MMHDIEPGNRDPRETGADIFAEVASEIRSRWARRGFSLAAFPEIAGAALATVNPAARPKLELLAGALARVDGGLHRACYHEADNVIPVYADEHFILTFHVWSYTFGNPHSHRWRGAFQNLSDPVVYADYDFELGEAFDNDLHFGVRRQTALRVLPRGEIVHVEQERSIHGFGHIGLPGLTLAARSRNVGGQTYDYWGGGLRITTGPDDELAQVATLRRRALVGLQRVSEGQAMTQLQRSFARGSLRANFMVALALVTTNARALDGISELLRTTHQLEDERGRLVHEALADRVFHEQALSLLASSDAARRRLLAASIRFAPDRQRFDGLLSEAATLDPGLALESLDDELAASLRDAGANELPAGHAGEMAILVAVLMFGGANEDQIELELARRYRVPKLRETTALLMRTIAALPLLRHLLAPVAKQSPTESRP